MHRSVSSTPPNGARAGPVDQRPRDSERRGEDLLRIAGAGTVAVFRPTRRGHASAVGGLLPGPRRGGVLRPRVSTDEAEPPLRSQPAQLRSLRYRWLTGLRRP